MIPYTIDRRPDTGVTNVTMGVWLFLASEVMLFGSLFSAYALLRTAAQAWPAGRDVLNVGMALANTLVLIGTTAAVWRAQSSTSARAGRWLLISTGLAATFVILKGLEYGEELGAGLVPATNTFLAMYFTLTGLHALHVIGGAAANLWVWAERSGRTQILMPGRLRAIALYWTLVDLVWLVILVLFYLT